MLTSLRAFLGGTTELAPTEATEEPSDTFVFEQVAGETHLAALQVAAVVSCINTLRQPGRLKDVSAIQDLAPRPTSGLRLAGKRYVPVRLFFGTLGAGHRQLQGFGADVEHFGLEVAAVFHLKPLSTSWCSICKLALKAIVAIDPELQRCLPDRYHQNTLVLAKLLRSAIDGGEPCIDASGRVFLPDLPQRRPSIRRNVHTPCVLEHHGQTSRALIRDISTGGLGLERADPLVPEKVVIIELPSGRWLAGTVVWSKGASAGVKFDGPLEPTDPLLVD